MDFSLPSIVNELKDIDEDDLAPSFMRVAISGEETSGVSSWHFNHISRLAISLSLIIVQVPLSDLHEASEALIKALLIRAKYMKASHQYFPLTTLKFLRKVCDDVPEFLAHVEDGDVENIQENFSSEYIYTAFHIKSSQHLTSPSWILLKLGTVVKILDE